MTKAEKTTQAHAEFEEMLSSIIMSPIEQSSFLYALTVPDEKKAEKTTQVHAQFEEMLSGVIMLPTEQSSFLYALTVPDEKKAEKTTQVHAQFEEMLSGVRKSLLIKLKQAMASGAIPDEYLEEDSYLLAKAIFDSWCRERTFSFEGINQKTQKEFNNIHTCC